MRIRGTKPEFWKSKRIAAVSWDARLVLKGLESYVDDNGVGVDDLELIVTDVFPRDMFASPRETVARVSEAITELFRAGLVHRYEVKGEHLIFVSFWESVQRIDKPGNGRNPRPDGTLNYKDSEIRESVASTPETLAPVTGEQGNRGTGEQGNSTEAKASVRPRKRATRIAEDFQVTQPMREWAAAKAPNADIGLETEKFINYWIAKSGKEATKLDWMATWRNWILNARTSQPVRMDHSARGIAKGAAMLAAWDARNEQDTFLEIEG